MISLQTERTNWRVIREAIDVEHTAERGEHGVVGDEVPIWSGLAERRDRAQHERGILAMKHLPAEPEPVERARREALDNDVGAARELQKNVRAARMVEVERQRALVEIVEPEKQTAVAMRQFVEERADAPRVVAGGRLYLDDVGAHVREESRAELCAMPAQVQHPQPRKRASAGRGHGFFAEVPACSGFSISSSSILTFGGGRSSIANALVSSVGGTSISTSFFGPVRLPPTTRIVSNVSGLTHRTPITAGFA